jgi:hypothetical protein
MRTAARGFIHGIIHRLRASQQIKSTQMEIVPATYRSTSTNLLALGAGDDFPPTGASECLELEAARSVIIVAS